MKLPRQRLEPSELPERARVEVNIGGTVYIFKVPQKAAVALKSKWGKRYLTSTKTIKKINAKGISKKPNELVKFYRTQKKLHQAQLAKRVNTSQAAISQIEKGSRGIGRDMARRLGKVLGVNYRDLL